MKFSEQWLRQWVNPQISTDKLSAQLTMAGLEVESVTPVANSFTDVVIGEILEAKPHPNADRLQVCLVNAGVDQPLQIVCGASNARVGIKVPVAMVGAVLSQALTIKKAKLRGVESAGMLCSAAELGLMESAEGLLELPHDAPVGLNIRQYLQLDDNIIYLNVTPNRSDCLSIQGVAREVAAINELSFAPPPLSLPTHSDLTTDTFPVLLHATTECPRYVGRIIRDVNLRAATPLWLQERLRRSDIRSINPVVDVTNYIMLELGQPMHAFDLSKLQQHIEVRLATENEGIALLDGQEIKLNSKTLVIADAQQAHAIAGVMGGSSSGVTGATTDVFLESAFFAPSAIAYAAKHYGIQSESAYRFERGVDPDLQVSALDRATNLLLSIVGGKPGPLIEKAALPNGSVGTKPFLLRRERIERILGVNIADAQVESILQRLGMVAVKENQGWKMLVPSHRFDIHSEIDVIEELARIYGYDQIPSQLPVAPLKIQSSSEATTRLPRMRQVLLDRGYNEIISYSFVAPALQLMLDPDHKPLSLLNPISQDMSVMRTNLWPGLVQAALYNVRRQETRIRLFESGLCFLPQANELLQESHLAGIALGSVYPEQWGVQKRKIDFFDLKGDIEALLSLTGCPQDFSFQPGAHPALHPNKSAWICRKGAKIGYAGELHPSLQQKLELDQSVYVFELALLDLQQGVLSQYKPLSKFPSVRRDLAFVMDERTTIQALKEKILSSSDELLKDIQLFDIYRGKGIDSGKKSVALGLTFQHPSRTLIDSEINDMVQNVIAVLEQEFGAKLRE